MGIRPKILLAFILCFGLMAGVNLIFLQRSVNKSYEAIERRELISQIERILHSIGAGLDSLNSQTRDWAEWTDMHEYALDPTGKEQWVKDNLASQSLESGDLSAVWIFGPHWQLLMKIDRNTPEPRVVLPSALRKNYEAIFKTASKGPNCGILLTDQGLLSACWARIVRTNFSGQPAGTLVMGRLLNPVRIAKLREVSGLPFDLAIRPDLPKALEFWPNTLSTSKLGSNGFWTEHDADAYRLYYPIQDVSQQNVGLISLQVPREVHTQGELLYAQVRQQMIWTAITMALLLGLILHGLLVSRLRTFTRQLLALTQQSSWGTRINIKGRDELGILASEVNKMLELIESQIIRLTTLSMTDTLTGLPNRRAFNARLALEQARKRREPRALALLLLDVDYFKRYNDRYGHPAGDSALQAVAVLLRQACLRAADLPARIGGEEFAVLLPETDTKGAMEIAGRIEQLLRECHIVHEDSSAAPWVTVSIGIALARDESLEAFVARADQALYTAKHHGRNRACCAEK